MDRKISFVTFAPMDFLTTMDESSGVPKIKRKEKWTSPWRSQWLGIFVSICVSQKSVVEKCQLTRSGTMALLGINLGV